MPSGNAGFMTLISTTIIPINMPYIHLPGLVCDPVTGSTAIKARPKAYPPITICQIKVTLNIGLVSDPIELNNMEVVKVPINTPITILQEATLVHKRNRSPNKINKVEVSPADPGILQTKASNQE